MGSGNKLPKANPNIHYAKKELCRRISKTPLAQNLITIIHHNLNKVLFGALDSNFYFLTKIKTGLSTSKIHKQKVKHIP